MSTPWRELKDAEITMLSMRLRGKTGSDAAWQRLRDLFEQCRSADDAEEAICFHGVASLLAERDGNFSLALKHRTTEIEKIVRLHELEVRNPTGGFATQNYESTDLESRRTILREIEAKL